MTQGAWQLGIGLFIGVGAAALLLGVIGAAALRNFLFRVNTLDPVVYGAVVAVLSVGRCGRVLCARRGVPRG
jgi:hypothetical protein